METPPELRCGRPSTAAPKPAAAKAKTAPTSAVTTPSPSPQPVPTPIAKAKTVSFPTTIQATTTPAPAAKAKAKVKAIGRLMKTEEGFVGEFRVDTGADETVFGKDLLGFVRSTGPSRGSYSTPLNTSRTMAETCVADVSIADVNGIEHPMKLKGIMNAGNNMSVLSVRTASFLEGNGTYALDGIPDVAFPCHARNGFPYAKIRFNGATKSIDALLSQLGFTTIPKPSIEELARAMHLKFACAGTDTLYCQAAIMGFHIPREVCRAVSTSCHFCPHKTLHGPIETIRSEDILAPDVTEATLNDEELEELKRRNAVAEGMPVNTSK